MSTERAHDAAHPRDNGFTMAEIIVTVVLLGALAAMVTLGMGRLDRKAQSEACTADLKTVEAAVQSWQVRHPGRSDVTEQMLVDDGLLQSTSKLHDVLAADTILPAGACLDGGAAAAGTSSTAAPGTTVAGSVAPGTSVGSATTTTDSTATTVTATTVTATTIAATTVPATSPATSPPTTTAPALGGWRVLQGTPSVDGDTVTVNGRAQLVNEQPMGQDGTFTASATLSRGDGFGLWLRAQLTNGSVSSAYSFDWDIGDGKYFALRLWGTDKKHEHLMCEKPLARSNIAKALQDGDAHTVSVTFSGQSFSATVDGTTVLTVENLTSAAKQACPQKAIPNGTLVGYRTWDGDAKVVFRDPVLA